MKKPKSRESQIAQRQLRLVESYAHAFRGVHGQEVLFDLMTNHWVLKSTAIGATSKDDILIREGERNVILRIMTLLKIDPRQLLERIEAHEKSLE
jgi:hypothetical protein